MLFRTQNIAVTPEGAVMAADAETVELLAATGGFGSLGELLQKNRTPVARSTSTRWTPTMRKPTGTATSGTMSR